VFFGLLFKSAFEIGNKRLMRINFGEMLVLFQVSAVIVVSFQGGK
jgi:hypothetical protein